jgi:subtilase family serine protease
LIPPYGGPGRFPCSHYWGDTRANLETTTPFPYGNNDLPWFECGYTPEQLREAYGSNKVPETGKGVRLAITDVYASPTIVADVNRYAANHGLPPLTQENFQQILQPGATAVPADDPCGYQSWWQEETLDVTAVHSMEPGASIVYVAGACDSVDSVDEGVAVEPVYQAIDTRLADIVTNSWLYNGEADLTPGELLTDNFEFIQAAAQGMNLLFAAGDDGDLTMSGEVYGGPNPVASGSWPATSPYVTAMGGTILLLKNGSGEKSEYGWATYETVFYDPLISPDGTSVTDQGQGWVVPFIWTFGGGGGPSLVMPEPLYQKKVVPTILATQTYLADVTPDPLSPAGGSRVPAILADYRVLRISDRRDQPGLPVICRGSRFGERAPVRRAEVAGGVRQSRAVPAAGGNGRLERADHRCECAIRTDWRAWRYFRVQPVRGVPDL